MPREALARFHVTGSVSGERTAAERESTAASGESLVRKQMRVRLRCRDKCEHAR
jgi:hypothetical protein